MKYRYVQTQPDYSDLAAGKVFQSLPGFTAFPVRLASEIFQRCLAIREAQGHIEPCVLYDPCCGSGYLLAITTYLHGNALKYTIGSDINSQALEFAERNLALLTPEGLETRLTQIEGMLASFNKPSHADALASARRMMQIIHSREQSRQTDMPFRVFQADATNASMMTQGLDSLKPDVVITDVPYGQRSSWTLSGDSAVGQTNPIVAMLDALEGVLSEHGVVAIASTKAQKFSHDGYRRMGQLLMGKRRIVFLSRIDGT